jgi:alpha-ribazole phosphatase
VSETTRWWWIRHAPVINPDGLIYGQVDLDAETADPAPFRALAARLPADPVLLVTPLRRTHQTLAALRPHAPWPAEPAAGPAADPAIEPDLIEQSFGDWQGQPREAVYGALGRRHPFWLSPAATRPPGGESFVDLMARTAAAIDRLSAAHAGRDVVVVAHGGTIRAAVAAALDLDPEAALRLAVDTLSLTRLDRIPTDDGPPAWRIGAVNVTGG